MPYFFDTYALIEIIKGNKNYDRFLDEEIITSSLNLGELFYAMVRETDEKTAIKWMTILNDNAFDAELDVIVEAIKFRLKNKKKKLSYIDCIGYVMAKIHGIKFLTGDKGFEGISNVEYVK